jgi:hypothetical protein
MGAHQMMLCEMGDFWIKEFVDELTERRDKLSQQYERLNKEGTHAAQFKKMIDVLDGALASSPSASTPAITPEL